MSALFGTKYFGFILSAYAITTLALVLLTVWLVLTYRSRRRQLDKLDKAGVRRAAKSDG